MLRRLKVPRTAPSIRQHSRSATLKDQPALSLSSRVQLLRSSSALLVSAVFQPIKISGPNCKTSLQYTSVTAHFRGYVYPRLEWYPDPACSLPISLDD